MTKKLAAFVLAFALLAAAGILFYPAAKTSAQQTGVASVPGQVFGQNQTPPAITAGAAGTVTNPASNFIINVQGGPVYFNGSEQLMGQSTMTLSASTTYLIVWNGTNETMYAKTAVTSAGSAGTNAINGPGAPTSLLFAYPNVEIPLATVVCGTTNCGNTANGSITDSRPVANFPTAVQVPSVTFANLPSSYPDGGVLTCSSCTVLTAGSATCTSGAGVDLAVRVGGAWRCY